MFSTIFDASYAEHMARADAEALALLDDDGHKFNCQCEVCAPLADSDAPLASLLEEWSL